MSDMLEGVTWFRGSSVRIRRAGLEIHVDPIGISDDSRADFILLTHPHYDNFSESDIDRVRTPRNRGARRHLDTHALRHAFPGHGVRVEGLHAPQLRGAELPRRVRVLRHDCIPVHRGAVDEGHVNRRDDIIGGDAVEGFGQRHPLRPRNRPREGHEHRDRVVKGDERPQGPHPVAMVLPVLVVVRGLHRRITPTAWPSSGRMRDFTASAHASGEPGRQKTSLPR